MMRLARACPMRAVLQTRKRPRFSSAAVEIFWFRHCEPPPTCRLFQNLSPSVVSTTSVPSGRSMFVSKNRLGFRVDARPARRTSAPTTNWSCVTPMRESTYGEPHDSRCHVAVSPDALVTRTLKAACGLTQETRSARLGFPGFHFRRTASASDERRLRPARATRTPSNNGGTAVRSLHFPEKSSRQRWPRYIRAVPTLERELSQARVQPSTPDDSLVRF